MKKFLMLLLCAAVLCVECAACDFSKPTTDESSASTTETAVVPQEDLDKQSNEFKNLISSLESKQFTKAKFSEYTHSGEKIKESEDKELIKQWISLLKKAKFSARKYETLFGSFSYGITFYEADGSETAIGIFTDNTINTFDGKNSTMIIIENYDELSDEFEKLEKQSGLFN